MIRALATALLVPVLGASPAAARELWRQGDAHLDVSGTLRELAVFTRGTDLGRFTEGLTSDPGCIPAATFADCAAWDALNDEDVGTSLTRLRGRVDLRASEHVSAVVVYDHEVRAGTLDTLDQKLGKGLQSDTLFRADHTIASGSHASWRHVLYRGYVFIETPRVELVLGRQRVPWGVGRLWNPIDRFNAIPPLSFQPDQSPGVDAFVGRWLFSGFTFLEAVAAPLRDPDDGSYAGRLHGVLFDVDYSLVAGSFEEALTFGFDLAGNVGDAAARAEVVFTHPQRKVRPVGQSERKRLSDYWQVVASIDHLFDVGSGVYVLVEHLYNGNALGFGEGKAGVFLDFFEETDTPPAAGIPPEAGPFVKPASPNLLGGSRVVTFAENQTGLQLGYDLTPELRGELLALYDWNGQSAAFVPSLRYSPWDWIEITLAGQLFAGPRHSQFGSAEPVGFVLADLFF